MSQIADLVQSQIIANNTQNALSTSTQHKECYPEYANLVDEGKSTNFISRNNLWIVDIGATSHITNSLHGLT